MTCRSGSDDASGPGPARHRRRRRACRVLRQARRSGCSAERDYVEIQAGLATIGFSKRRFTEYSEDDATRPDSQLGTLVLDFEVTDVDAEYPRVAALGVEWVMTPTTQPWGNRSMIFRDPDGNLVNVFSRPLPRPQ
ncbi:MAG: VOC family protein [Streptosporangiaceae bacterium]